MVVMALDHVRDFFHNGTTDPTDLATTTGALFGTRWITHFCAPVFVFLAGTGAYLSGSRGKSKADLSRFLLTRGVWLIFLEVTVVRFGWLFNVDYTFCGLGVIWAIGWSMIVLAGLVFLPDSITGLFGVAMIAAHNLLDGVRPESLGSWGSLWTILHVQGELAPMSGVHLFVRYPLIPWVGVMAAGYGFGSLLQLDRSPRRKYLTGLGIILSLTFVILRATNTYGDPYDWSTEKNVLFTVFSFVNCEKYPPSLLFLLMTLGPAIVSLAVFDRDLGLFTRRFVVFGRVPLFYYLIHLPLIHGLALVFAYVRHGTVEPMLHGSLVAGLPEGFGYGLPVVYLVWVGVVVILYPACAWFARLKQRSRSVWSTYF